MTLYQSEAARLGKKRYASLVDAMVRKTRTRADEPAISVPVFLFKDKRKTPQPAEVLTGVSAFQPTGGHFPPIADFAGGLLLEKSVPGKGIPIGEPVTLSQAKPDVKVLKVGIWDIDSLAGDMALVTSSLNAAQKRFCFFEVSGAAPAGLISDKDRVVAWFAEHKRRLKPSEKREIKENTIAEDFYPQARKLRLQLGLHYIIGLTSSMIAFDNDGHLEYNYFATYDKHELLVSSYGLRKYAAKAGRPLEAALGGVLLSILLVAVSPKLEYHHNTGCLFDFNDKRDSIVKSIREVRIDTDCRGKIRADVRQAADAMVDTLRALPMPGTGA